MFFSLIIYLYVVVVVILIYVNWPLKDEFKESTIYTYIIFTPNKLLHIANQFTKLDIQLNSVKNNKTPNKNNKKNYTKNSKIKIQELEKKITSIFAAINCAVNEILVVFSWNVTTIKFLILVNWTMIRIFTETFISFEMSKSLYIVISKFSRKFNPQKKSAMF